MDARWQARWQDKLTGQTEADAERNASDNRTRVTVIRNKARRFQSGVLSGGTVAFYFGERLVWGEHTPPSH